MAREAPYLEIADDLRERVNRGEWARGARLPSRAQFAKEYGVGRNVTQRAVDLLIAEGLLEGRAGSGTYLRPPRERGRMVRSWHHAERGGGPTRVGTGEPGDLSNYTKNTLADIAAPAHIAERLGIAEGDLCTRTQYDYMNDNNQPVQLSESWEPMAITKGTPVELAAMGSRGETVVARMLRIGIEVTSALEVPRPGRVTRPEAARLKITPGDLVVRLERTYYDRNGRAVETADIVVPDSRWEIAYEIGIHPR